MEEKPLEMEGVPTNPRPIEDVDNVGQEADKTQEQAAKQAGPPRPQENRMEISIVWVNGRVAVKAPANPIMVMKVMGQALDYISNEFFDIARKAQEAKMFDPGPDVPFVPDPNTQKVVEAVNKQMKG